MVAEFTVTASIVPKSPLDVGFAVTETGSFLDDGTRNRTQTLTFTASTVPGETTATATYSVALDDDGVP